MARHKNHAPHRAVLGVHPTMKVEVNPKEMRKLYNKPLSARDIMHHYGWLAISTVYYHMRKHGIERRSYVDTRLLFHKQKRMEK